MKAYKVVANPISTSVEEVAESIEDLARDIRGAKDALAIQQSADAIMHLAADLKWNAETVKKEPTP